MPKRKYTEEEKQIYLYNLLFQNGYSEVNTQNIIKKICNRFDTLICQKIFIELIINILYSFLYLKIIQDRIKNLNKNKLTDFKNLVSEFKTLTNNIKQTVILPINIEYQIDDLLNFFYDLQDHMYGYIVISYFARSCNIIHQIILLLKK